MLTLPGCALSLNGCKSVSDPGCVIVVRRRMIRRGFGGRNLGGLRSMAGGVLWGEGS